MHRQKQIHTMLRCTRTGLLKEYESITSNNQVFFSFILPNEQKQYSFVSYCKIARGSLRYWKFSKFSKSKNSLKCVHFLIVQISWKYMHPAVLCPQPPGFTLNIWRSRQFFIFFFWRLKIQSLYLYDDIRLNYQLNCLFFLCEIIGDCKFQMSSSSCYLVRKKDKKNATKWNRS